MDISNLDISKVEFKAECSRCNEETTTGSVGVKLKDIIVENKKYMITYISCEKCGSDIILQVDNEKTKTILSECKNILSSKVKAKKKMKHFSDKKNARLGILQNTLRKERKHLAKDIHGKPYYDCDSKKTAEFANCSFILDGIKEVHADEN